MQADKTLIKIIKEIGDEIYRETGLDFSDAELAELIDSQFFAIELGINKGFDVRCPTLGRFINIKRLEEKQRIKISKEEIETLKLLKSDYEVTQEEIKRKRESIKRLKEKLGVKETISFSNLMKVKSTTKGARSKYNKLLNSDTDV